MSLTMVSRVLALLLVLVLALLSLVNAEALPLATANANPQVNTYAPFSGAIYIVGGMGTQFSAAAPAICPAKAPQGCGNINIWNWCCPASSTCALLSNGVVGCCPIGASCSGSVSTGQISTITAVPQYATIQTIQQNVQPQQTVPYVVGGAGAGAGAGGVYVTSMGNVQATVVMGNFCQTVYMKGNPIPTTARGNCGTILILNGADTSGVGVWKLVVVVLGHLMLGVLGIGWRISRT